MNDESPRVQPERRSVAITEEIGSPQKEPRKSSLSEEEKAARRKASWQAANARTAKLRRENPALIRARDKKYREAIPGKHAQKNREWREANLDRSKEYHRNYMKTRAAIDPNYRKRKSLANHIRIALRRGTSGQSPRSAKLREMLGCDMIQLRAHLEAQFKPGMTWENYGRIKGVRCWEIDHKIPCIKFDLTIREQQLKCFHFSNLQPLWSVDNLRKNTKISPEEPAFTNMAQA